MGRTSGKPGGHWHTGKAQRHLEKNCNEGVRASITHACAVKSEKEADKKS